MNRLFESSLLNHVAASSLRFDYTPLLTAKAQPEQKDLVVKDEKRSREFQFASTCRAVQKCRHTETA